jgi:sulfide:quinone oxidoreductase
MDIRHVTDEVSVCGQIGPDDVAALAEAGFRSIVCNRPDGEAVGQPDFAAIEAEAERLGIETRYIPVVSGMLHEEDVGIFQEAYDELPKPLLAFCRSGTRSVTIWSLSQAGRKPTAEIVQSAREAGYDLSGLAPRIDHRATRG